SALGVRPGDRVGLLAGSRYEWVVMQYATALAGGILVPLSPYGTVPEVRHVLRNAGVRALFHAARFRGTDLSSVVAAARADCPDVRHVVDLDHAWPDFLATGDDSPEPADDPARPGDPAAILYTSGTTGSPKGVTLSHRGVVNNAFAVGRLLGYDHT